VSVESHIGQYRILRTLGTGGMGTVYLGEHLLLGRRAAIKTLLPALSVHREIVERFFTEAKAISAISDPGVVQIFDFGYHVDGTAYIVMEYLEGESLQSRLDRLGKLPLAEALRLARQIASSLGAAHARGVVHRDLKPANVFVIRDKEAQGGERTKILDFGICKLTNKEPNDGTITEAGTMLGTPVYMSPEQCRGSGDVDQRADIYSVGCGLFHMLTGQPPFDCESAADFIASHLREDPPAPSERAPELQPAVDAIVMRCLAKEPADRYQTMTDLSVALEEILATLSDPGRTAPPPPLPTTPLSDGYRSGYDVNNNALDVPTGRPVQSNWFMDSQAVAAASIQDDDDAWVEPARRKLSMGQRMLLVFALVLGLFGGLAATSVALDNDDAEVASGPTVTETVRAAARTTMETRRTHTPPAATVAPAPAATVPAPLPPAPPVPETGSAADDAADRSARFEQDARSPVAEKTPERPRVIRKAPPVRRARPAAQPEPNKPEVDLYETR
jgi:serine/threonine protein kinase